MTKKLILTTPLALLGIFTLIAQSENNIIIDHDIQLIHIQDSIFVHVTWHQLDNFVRFSSKIPGKKILFGGCLV